MEENKATITLKQAKDCHKTNILREFAHRIKESSEQWYQLSVTANISRWFSRNDQVINTCLSVKERAFHEAIHSPGVNTGG